MCKPDRSANPIAPVRRPPTDNQRTRPARRATETRRLFWSIDRTLSDINRVSRRIEKKTPDYCALYREKNIKNNYQTLTGGKSYCVAKRYCIIQLLFYVKTCESICPSTLSLINSRFFFVISTKNTKLQCANRPLRA